MITSKAKKSHHHSHHSHRRVRDENYDLQREKEMVRNRIVLILITLCASYFLDASMGIFIGLFAHLFGSLAIIISYRIQPNPSDLRRFAGLVTDFGAGYYLFSTFGESVAVLYPIYLWVILGYGFRFGNRWLLVSAILGAGSFGASIINVPFWQENQSLTIGLLAGLIVVPAYCSTLITKLSLAKEEAEKANKAKTLFLASISHELRTPLNAIIGYGTHLLDMGLPDRQKQMVGTSVSAGRHLLHLINQLLSFAKSESIEELPEPEAFRPTDILAEVRDIMQIAADEKGLDLNLQAEVLSDKMVFGQSDYVKNILINLTSNAIKFTDSGSILLKCGLTEDGGQLSLWCSVTDTGPGIALDAQEKIFGVFQQADDTVGKKFGGTGLGLAICRQLADQLGGEITLDSEIDVGSTFRLSCPVEATQRAPEAKSAKPIHILSVQAKSVSSLIELNDANEVAINYLDYSSVDELIQRMDHIDLSQFDIALVSKETASAADHHSSIWQRFHDAKLPPVLVSDNDSKSLDEICLRASFASVLPASPDFEALRSAVQIGCSFHIENADESSSKYITAAPSQPRNILIADDNRTNLMVLETILINAGHDVTLVSDGEQALEKLENGSYDIVFLDVNMPKIGGIECCKLWRQIEGPRKHIPMIALTADSTEETEKRCLDAGMDLRLTKPIEAGQLLSAVDEQTQSGTDAVVESEHSDPNSSVRPINSEPLAAKACPIDQSQLDYLLSIGDSDFVQSIIDAYIDDSAEILAAITKATKSSDIEAFRFHAHAFKSGANNVGAKSLATLCGKLEVISEPDFATRRFEYLDRVRDEVENIENYFKSAKLDAPTADGFDLDQTG